ncbi:MAG: M1 family metallopeptidase [Bacteroidota bacterium]|nr:M1 family metallopeptidase [Bacteroidota bacterium]
MRILLLFILNVVITIQLHSQVKPTVPAPERIRFYDVQHIKVNVSFDWENKTVAGDVMTTITPLENNLSEFEVDAVALKINHIRDEKNDDLNFDYDGKMIKIKLNKNYTPADTITYSVNYSCKPEKGLYFIYPTELNPSLPYQIWTQGEQNDHRHWIPLYDYPNDKTTFEMYVTVDKKLKTLSNGYLNYSGKIPDTDKRQDHWVMDKPNSTYLIMLAVGDFNVIEDKVNNLPVQSYVDQNVSLDDAKYSFRNTIKMAEVFSDKFQYRYPWNKYAQVVVEDYIYGGMENTTATVLNKRALYSPEIENDYSSDPLISHELGHQWWGDLTTCRNWSEMWLNESFATFSTSIWKENYYGDDEYDYDILINGDDALKTDSVTGRYPVWAGYGSVTTNIYDKGCVIINSFRHILGDEIFFNSLENFLKDNEFKNVVSNDLLESINNTYNSANNSNEDFKWMFDQWIWKAGYPKFEINYKYDESLKKLNLNVKQVQTVDTLTLVFRMPVDIRIKNSSEDKVERVEILDDDETFAIDLNSQPEMVIFDYGNNLLDKTYFDKPFEDWKAQFTKSENAIDRIMALRGLDRFLKEDNSQIAGKPAVTINQIETLNLFEDAIKYDKYRGVRIEAVKVLAKNLLSDRTGNILKNSYDIQSDSRVKREILKALGISNRSEDADFVKSKIQNESNDYIIAEGISALGKSLSKDEVYDAVLPYVNKISHRDVIQGAVIDALDSADNKSKDGRFKKIIMDIAFGIDVEGRFRTRAINALRTYAEDEDVKTLAMKYADFNFIFVKRAFITLLAYSKDKSVIPFLRIMNDKTTDEEFSKLLLKAIKMLDDS